MTILTPDCRFRDPATDVPITFWMVGYEEEEEREGENCDDPCLNGDTEACEALQDIAQVSAGGQFTCGRTGAGDVWCWGSNAQGRSAMGRP